MLNAKLNSVFKGNNKYFGRIIISKINLDYYVYNSYSEEMLKILPCKFYGNNLEDYGNICIIGHNYFDDRFFSNLNKLRINDKIEIQDLSQNKYIYTIFNIYEIDENNIENVISQDKDKYLLTLCTCTFNKKKRLIIKAVR
jgi:LPXTG-site transpeptidase (sortase) family protein